MKKNEIKKTIEQVVRVEYVAEDGTVFYNEDEAKKYEESALFEVSKRLKKLASPNQQELLDTGYEDQTVEIFDIQTEEDLSNLKRYIYLTLQNNGAHESTIKDCFSPSECRKDFGIDGITYGHEVLIWWSYDVDWVWTFRDGSLDAYFSWIKDRYTKIITPKEPEPKSE